MTPPEEPCTRWAFQPGSAPVRSEEALSFRRRLGASVRLARAQRIRWAIEISTGPSPVLEVLTFAPDGSRWFARALAPLYGRHQWRAISPPRDRASSARWFGAAGLPPKTGPAEGSLEPGELCEAAALGLGTLPAGARIRWTWSPVAPESRRWEWLAGPLPPFAPVRSPRDTRRREPLPPPVLVPAAPATWSVRIAVFTDSVLPRELASLRRRLDDLGAAGEFPRFRMKDLPRWWGRAPVSHPVPESALLSMIPSREGLGLFLPALRLPPEGAPIVGRADLARPVALPWQPLQGRHLAVLGETGMGKSELLSALAGQAAGGASVIFFDPVGDTARRFLARLPPASRPRAWWISPAEPVRGINALETPGALGAAGREVHDLVLALRRVRAGHYPEGSFWGPRIEEIATRALAAAASLPHGTIVDAHTLLDRSLQRDRTESGSRTPAIVALESRVRERPEDAEGARRLFFEIAGNPLLVRLLCERHPAHTAADLVRPRGVTMIVGDVPGSGEATARQLLAVYLALVWSAILRRGPGEKIVLVLDEVQSFAHDALAEILRLGRRFDVHVVLATQALGSLPDSVADAVRTNVADFALFRGSPDDAREFARMVRGVSMEEIQSLATGEAVLLRGKGESVEFIRTPIRSFDAGASTDPGPAPPAPGDRVRAASGSARDDRPTAR